MPPATAPITLDGAGVLVTGASAGIGAALAVELASRGARVGLVGRRADKLDEVTERCLAHGPGHRSWVVDLAKPDSAERVAGMAWLSLGGLDVVVNNAAIPMRKKLLSLTTDDLDETMRVNFFSPVRIGQFVVPKMLAQGRGLVVNVSSLGGRLGIPAEAAYCASKFALCGWTETMALDLWDTPVGVRLIIPGPVDTEIWDRPGSEPADYDGPLEPPETVAAGIADAIESDRFEHYLPDLKGVAEFKTSDIDTFLDGAAAMAAQGAARLAAESGNGTEPAAEADADG